MALGEDSRHSRSCFKAGWQCSPLSPVPRNLVEHKSKHILVPNRPSPSVHLSLESCCCLVAEILHLLLRLDLGLLCWRHVLPPVCRSLDGSAQLLRRTMDLGPRVGGAVERGSERL